MRGIPFLLVLVLFLPSLGLAAEAAPASTEQLPDMVVTATAVPAPKHETPVHVQVIDRPEIERLGVDTLDELLIVSSPGTVIKYPGAYTSFRLRGFDSYSSPGANMEAKTLVLVDGNPLGTGNASLIPLDNVERVEIMRGPGSVLYGASAMGGVINILTRRGKGEASGSLGVEYGSNEHIQGSASLQGSASDGKLGYALAGSISKQNDYDDGHGHRYENSAYHDGAFSATCTLRPTEEHSLHLLANYFNAWELGSPGPTYAVTEDPITYDAMKYMAAVYDGGVSDWGVRWRLSGWMGEHKYSDTDTLYYDDSDFLTYNLGVDGRVTVPTFSVGTFTVGGKYQFVEEKRTGDGVYAPDSRYNNWSVYGEERININDFTFVAGIRYDQYTLKINRNGTFTDVLSEEKDLDQVSWRAGVTWWALDWLSLRASVGTAFSPPDAYKYCGRYALWGTNYIGNSNLSPETSLTWEGGFDVTWNGLEFSGTYFHTTYENATTSTTTTVDGDPFWFTWTNSDGWLLTGLEGFFKYTKAFSIDDHTITVSPYVNGIYYLQREEQDSDIVRQLGTDTVLNLSEYSITPGIQTSFDSLVMLDINMQWQGPQEVRDWDPLSPRYTEVVDKDPFAVLNARVTVKPVDCLEVSLHVDNITDENYSYVDGYPMPGRTFGVGLKYTF